MISIRTNFFVVPCSDGQLVVPEPPCPAYCNTSSQLRTGATFVLKNIRQRTIDYPVVGQRRRPSQQSDKDGGFEGLLDEHADFVRIFV